MESMESWEALKSFELVNSDSVHSPYPVYLVAASYQSAVPDPVLDRVTYMHPHYLFNKRVQLLFSISGSRCVSGTGC